MTAGRPPIDKRGLLASKERLRDVVVELGCGPKKHYEHSISIDAIDGDAIDIVGDALEVLKMFPPDSARLISSSHFLEHVPDPGILLEEMARVLGEGGEIEIVVPHFSHPYYHSDPTHMNRVGFGLYTMSYYAIDPLFQRQVPGYVRREELTIKRVDLRFKSAVPFYGRHAIKRLIGTVFNSTTYLQELWEESLCYIFPCYEIRYVLIRTADRAS